MSTITPVAEIAAKSAGSVAPSSRLQLEVLQVEPGAGAQFRAALERYLSAGPGAAASQPGANKVSLGDKIMTRATDLASEVKRDHQHVSKMLEQATRTGDSMQLMKAMLALNDYQTRVQFISKVTSKAASSVDQLTKLQ